MKGPFPSLDVSWALSRSAIAQGLEEKAFAVSTHQVTDKWAPGEAPSCSAEAAALWVLTGRELLPSCT